MTKSSDRSTTRPQNWGAGLVILVLAGCDVPLLAPLIGTHVVEPVLKHPNLVVRTVCRGGWAGSFCFRIFQVVPVDNQERKSRARRGTG